MSEESKSVYGVFVGANKETIKEARAAIISILNSRCDEKTKREAIKALSELAAVNHTSLTGCNFNVGHPCSESESKEAAHD